MTVTLSYSQNTYPKKIVIENDTVIIITPMQLREVNCLLTQRDMYEEVITSCESKIDGLNVQIVEAQKMIYDRDKLISLQEDQIEDLNKIILNGENIELLINKEIRNQKTKRIKSNLISVTGTALLFIIINSLSK